MTGPRDNTAICSPAYALAYELLGRPPKCEPVFSHADKVMSAASRARVALSYEPLLIIDEPVTQKGLIDENQPQTGDISSSNRTHAGYVQRFNEAEELLVRARTILTEVAPVTESVLNSADRHRWWQLRSDIGEWLFAA